MKKTYLLILFMVLASFAVAIYFYNVLPDRIATHWNAAGEADGFSSRTNVFSIPALIAGMSALLVFLPKLDPLKKNISKFRRYYDGFILAFVFFMLYLYLLTLLWNLDYRFNMVQALVPAFAFLFFYLGIVLENAKRNWFIGIRTPWTLSDEKVWEKTHVLGGKGYKTAAVLAIAGLVFERYAIFFVIIPIIIVSLVCVVYSYFVWRKSTSFGAR
jgi:uncharacterized membrane protein